MLRTLIALFCLSSLVTPNMMSSRAEPTFTSQNTDSGLIILRVTVTDKTGAIVQDLNQSAFRLTSRSQVEDIALFSSGRDPASISFLFDRSASMAQATKAWLGAVREGIAAVLEQGHEYRLALFSGEPTVAVDWVRDNRAILDVLDAAVLQKARGLTALYDAFRESIEDLSRRAGTNHVIVLVSDGQDSISKTGYGKLKDILKHSDVSIFAVVRSDPSESFSDFSRSVIDELTRVSGGNAHFVFRPREVTTAFLEIVSRIRYHYKIGFYPKTLDGKWHPLELNVSIPSKGNPTKMVRLNPQARQGYYALDRR